MLRLLYSGLVRPTLRLRVEGLLLTIDLVGTALFAAEGATTAMQAKLDILGVLTLAFVTAVGGGLVRDLLLGDVPPGSIKDWRYAGIAFASGLAIFFMHGTAFGANDRSIILLDAAGLSFFAVAGATKALEYKLHPLLSIMMGGITAVGGGTVRDLLINRVPRVLVSDVYASAGLLGASVTVLLLEARVRPLIANSIGIVVCFTLRMLAVQHGWSLPGAQH